MRNKIDLDELLLLHSQGLTDKQIADSLKCSPVTIENKRNILRLPNNENSWINNYIPAETVDKIKSYYDKGWSDVKIVKRMHKDGINIKLTSVKYWRRINKLPEGNKRILESTDVKGKDSIFCDGKFLESILNKPLRTEECE
jgi:hypothetical protein